VSAEHQLCQQLLLKIISLVEVTQVGTNADHQGNTADQTRDRETLIMLKKKKAKKQKARGVHYENIVYLNDEQ